MKVTSASLKLIDTHFQFSIKTLLSKKNRFSLSKIGLKIDFPHPKSVSKNRSSLSNVGLQKSVSKIDPPFQKYVSKIGLLHHKSVTQFGLPYQKSQKSVFIIQNRFSKIGLLHPKSVLKNRS